MVDRNTSTNYVGDWAKGRLRSRWEQRIRKNVMQKEESEKQRSFGKTESLSC
jgi:hypothetical protein